ncbi:MAG: hypothetical protein ABI871_06915 [Chthoniobacterales bacterium]
MKLSTRLKLGMTVGVAIFSLSAYVMAGDHGQSGQHGHRGEQGRAQQGVSPTATPPGHHYGWEKGKHNPHRSPGVSPSPTGIEPTEPAATPSPTP